MKRIVLLILLTGFGFTYLTLDNSLEQLGIRREAAIEYIRTSIDAGALAFPASVKKIPDHAKAVIAADMVRLAREYTLSAEFRKWYGEYRKSKMPRPPSLPTASASVQINDPVSIQQQISDAEQKMMQLPEGQRGDHQKYIEGLKVRLKQVLQTPPSAPVPTPPADPASQVYTAQLKSYQDSLTMWQQELPENPDQLLRLRLQRYLDISSTVDFSAQTTVDAKGIRHFSNSDYEKKPGSWKRVFRTGKEANDMVRPIVKEWITTLR